MTDDEATKKIKVDLARDRDERNDLMSKARDFHYDKLLNCSKDYTDYIVKLGELSFLIGAAIAPIIIASDKPIQHPRFIFAAIIMYLFNGVIAMWKSKDMIERKLDAFAPGNLHSLEKKIFPLQALANKIIADFKPEDINKYIEEEKKFIKTNAEEKTDTKVNIFLDILVFFFLLSSLLLTRTVWPFTNTSYWYFFSVSIITILMLIIFGIIKARSVANNNEKNTQELNDMHLEYAKWWEEKMENDPK